MQALCGEYEQRLAQSDASVRKLTQENSALQQHCQTLNAQNQRMAGQNATLAGSSEKYSRQMQELDSQMSGYRERIHSLGDQIAVLRLKNGDLNKENMQLKERAEQAEAELRVKGRALDAEKASMIATRGQRMAEADAEAAHVVAEAEKKAEQVVREAEVKAEAIDRTARTQARRQAQNIVNGAAAEANEIQNAHQLRLNHLAAEVRELEKRREALLHFLEKVGSDLLEVRNNAPEITVEPSNEEPSAPETLEDYPTPEAELDLSDDALTPAMLASRAARAAAAAVADATGTPSLGEPLPLEEEPDEEPSHEPHHHEDSDPSRQTGPALTEVPGAIFSSPILNPQMPTVDEAPPEAGPRTPVLPSELSDDDEMDTYIEELPPADYPPEEDDSDRFSTAEFELGDYKANTEPAPPAKLEVIPVPTPITEGPLSAEARRKALRAVKALRRQMIDPPVRR